MRINPALVATAAVLGLLSTLGADPAPSAAPSTYSCEPVALALVQKVEEDYVAFAIERIGTHDSYVAARTALLSAAKGAATQDACFDALTTYVNYFDDGHLFLLEDPDLTDDAVKQLQASAPTTNLTESDVLERLSHRLQLDPIEGIWYSDQYKVGIVRDPNSADHFVAVFLTEGLANWHAGQLKAEFWKNADGSYRAVVYSDIAHLRRHSVARLYRNLLLAMPPRVWGRVLPAETGAEAALDPTDPEKPTLAFRDPDTAVLAIPSHDPKYRVELDALLQRNATELQRHKNLIVDIRGDLGGSTGTTDGLFPYLYSTAQRPGIGPQGQPVVLGSKDEIAYFTAVLKQVDSTSEYGKEVAEVLTRMKSHIGQIVPFGRTTSAYDTPDKPNDVYANPVNVAILIDRGDASAAEEFILLARRFKRVTLFGAPTSGTIDYQSVDIVSLASGQYGLDLGFPTVAATATLPADGFRGRGIPPDVTINDNVKDPIAFIIAWYEHSRPISSPRKSTQGF